jgi:ubiquinone/menaquinone biosynthesis C-methylase UbiE
MDAYASEGEKEIAVQSIAQDAGFWDRAARKYALSPIKDMAGYERSINRTRRLLRQDDAVLEIGCGTGTSALLLAPGVASITGVDVSREMITIARDKAAAEGRANVAFMVGSADEALADEATYDAVLAFNLLHLVTDRAAVYARIRRHLKPGGLFISKTACIAEMNPLIRLAVLIMRMIGKAPTVSSFDADGLVEELKQAGFNILERSRHGSGRKDPRIFIVAQLPEG